jgi:hypothetical protein
VTAPLVTPFTPASTARLQRGQFWSLPLDNGRFGAGCVVGRFLGRKGKPSRRIFLAGVVAWIGSKPPTRLDLSGCRLLDHGFAHIKSILETGGQVLGTADLDFGELPEAAESLSVHTWGHGVPAVIAQKYAATHS